VLLDKIGFGKSDESSFFLPVFRGGLSQSLPHSKMSQTQHNFAKFFKNFRENFKFCDPVTLLGGCRIFETAPRARAMASWNIQTQPFKVRDSPINSILCRLLSPILPLLCLYRFFEDLALSTMSPSFFLHHPPLSLSIFPHSSASVNGSFSSRNEDMKMSDTLLTKRIRILMLLNLISTALLHSLPLASLLIMI
jgi:hypothetical protein